MVIMLVIIVMSIPEHAELTSAEMDCEPNLINLRDGTLQSVPIFLHFCSQILAYFELCIC